MIRRCPYCGEKIPTDASQCDHCGKTLIKKKTESSEKPGLTNLESWKEKLIPTWLMFLVVALALFCVWAMLAEGCQK